MLKAPIPEVALCALEEADEVLWGSLQERPPVRLALDLEFPGMQELRAPNLLMQPGHFKATSLQRPTDLLTIPWHVHCGFGGLSDEGCSVYRVKALHPNLECFGDVCFALVGGAEALGSELWLQHHLGSFR